MQNSDEQRPCMMGRAVCGTAGLVGTLIRLSAGVVAIACLGVLVAGRIRKQGKKKKMPLLPPRLGNGRYHKEAGATRVSSGRQGKVWTKADRLPHPPAGGALG